MIKGLKRVFTVFAASVMTAVSLAASATAAGNEENCEEKALTSEAWHEGDSNGSISLNDGDNNGYSCEWDENGSFIFRKGIETEKDYAASWFSEMKVNYSGSLTSDGIAYTGVEFIPDFGDRLYIIDVYTDNSFFKEMEYIGGYSNPSNASEVEYYNIYASDSTDELTGWSGRSYWCISDSSLGKRGKEYSTEVDLQTQIFRCEDFGAEFGNADRINVITGGKASKGSAEIKSAGFTAEVMSKNEISERFSTDKSDYKKDGAYNCTVSNFNTDNGRFNMNMNGGGRFDCKWEDSKGTIYFSKGLNCRAELNKQRTLTVDAKWHKDNSTGNSSCFIGEIVDTSINSALGPCLVYIIEDYEDLNFLKDAVLKTNIDGYEIYTRKGIDQYKGYRADQIWVVNTRRNYSGECHTDVAKWLRKLEKALGIDLIFIYGVEFMVYAYGESGGVSVERNNITIPKYTEDKYLRGNDETDRSGFHYSIASSSADLNYMIINVSDNAICSWEKQSENEESVFRKGIKLPEPVNTDDYDSIYFSLGTYIVSDDSYFAGIYGHTKDSGSEFYIVNKSASEDFLKNAVPAGNADICGCTYSLYTSERLNADGTSIKQFWSVLNNKLVPADEKKTETDLIQHIEKWKETGLAGEPKLDEIYAFVHAYGTGRGYAHINDIALEPYKNYGSRDVYTIGDIDKLQGYLLGVRAHVNKSYDVNNDGITNIYDLVELRKMFF
ncbi:MAG: glycoside hydrolase family 11 protein [Ruminococcus sp.]|uniref:glycoside hydrolase family 11 protein n=1 Tax=Ruminococcus sp. TaxID=41978 RepID=UPI0025E4F748|nr:glycoside hydrolase family 11 protein [Ruminococcus sp.]MBR5683778.1 glycoside hydrolase family 11 protein [Ruminococcus sp.]